MPVFLFCDQMSYSSRKPEAFNKLVWQVGSICMFRKSRRRKKLMKIHVSINSLDENGKWMQNIILMKVQIPQIKTVSYVLYFRA